MTMSNNENDWVVPLEYLLENSFILFGDVFPVNDKEHDNEDETV